MILLSAINFDFRTSSRQWICTRIWQHSENSLRVQSDNTRADKQLGGTVMIFTVNSIKFKYEKTFLKVLAKNVLPAQPFNRDKFLPVVQESAIPKINLHCFS